MNKKKKKMDIIFEDKELLVVNKPSGLLTIATEKEKIKTLYHEARMYIKKQNPKNKIFIVHRLDKETSGIVLFAKSEHIKNELQKNWNQIAIKREYIAIVEGNFEEKETTLTYYLKENKAHHVYVTTEKTKDLAITEVKKIDNTKSYSLLKINLKTGKKNQIRASLNEKGYPIIGDKKYGSTKNPIGRLGLHASILELELKKKKYCFNSKIPENFEKMFPRSIIKNQEMKKKEKNNGKITKSNSQ